MIDEIRTNAVNRVHDAFSRGVSCGYIYVPTGMGKNLIIESIIVDELKRDSEANILVAFKTRTAEPLFTAHRNMP